MKKPKLIIFDFDGTILDNPDFYRKFYSGTLEKLVEKERGKYGLKILHQCRENFDGKGELSLFVLNIPFKKWADVLVRVPLDMIKSDMDLVAQIRKIDAIKIIYTGSPAKMVYRFLAKLGFSINDFNLIVGWVESEQFPVKWSGSALVFEKIIAQFNCTPEQSFAVGDKWDTDLMPAKTIGIKTIQIKNQNGKADLYFDTLQDFLNNF